MKASLFGASLHAAPLALALAVGGCVLPTDTVHERRIGTLDLDNSSKSSFVVPPTAEVGEEFLVYVTTYATSCARQGDTKVTVTGLRAKVIPYDVELRPASGGGCGGMQRFIHSGTVRFDEAGEARVVVSGWSGSTGELIELEKTVIVGGEESSSMNAK
ncbi:MAG TPA: hypothetical protein VHG91_04420 [Longimicrobium sp.]|nr:hypothetical protein [Longimicrobium sp.]